MIVPCQGLYAQTPRHLTLHVMPFQIIPANFELVARNVSRRAARASTHTLNVAVEVFGVLSVAIYVG
jgi:hypothetical protein